MVLRAAFAVCLLGCTAHGQPFQDIFNGSTVDATLWQTSAPFVDSSITASNGFAVFQNRGRLLCLNSLPGSVDIIGRFAFTGNPHDSFVLVTRCDGVSTLSPGFFEHGISFRFEIQDDSGSTNGTLAIQRYAYPASSPLLASGDFPITSNVFYTFRIRDDGTNLALYVGDLSMPLLEAADTTRFGGKLGLFNREGAGGGTPIDAGSVVQLDYLTVGPATSKLSDPPPLTVSDVGIIEGDTGITNAIFTLRLSSPRTNDTRLRYYTADGTARAGLDYIATNGFLTIPAGALTQSVIVPVIGERLYEPDETFFVYFTNNPTPLGPAILNGSFETGTNPGSSLNIYAPDSNIIQGWTVTAGSIDYIGSRWAAGDGTRCVDLSGVGPGAILQTVTGFVPGQRYQLSFLMAGNPEAGPALKTLTATVGSASTNYTFDTTGKTITQLGWSFKTLDFTATNSSMDVAFSSQTGGFAGPALDLVRLPPLTDSGTTVFSVVAMGVITNDDPLPRIFIEDRSFSERDVGTNLFQVNVMLSNPSVSIVAVDFTTIDGTAANGLDYVSTSGTLQFLPGTTNRTVAVYIIGDTTDEPDETFFVHLDSPVNATLGKTNGIITILDDDIPNLPPTVTITNPANGAVIYAPPGLISVNADARDSDGFVERVDFYDGTNFIYLGTATNAPWTLPWSTNLVGSFLLTAVATDNAGARSTSAPVHIQIRSCSGILTASPLLDQTACVCEAVVFSTTVTSSDPVSFVWRRNGQLIPDQTKSVLVLPSLKTNHAGSYSVEISSPCQQITNIATLTIQGDAIANPLVLSNAMPITIDDKVPASPYPSIISVKCVPGPVQKVTVSVYGLSHTSTHDIDMLLANPFNQGLKLLSDAGRSAVNVDLTFSDSAVAGVAAFPVDIVSGNYRPTDFGVPTDDSFPNSISLITTLAGFKDVSANGDWGLYVRDDEFLDTGTVARGWSLSIDWDDSAPRLRFPTNLFDGRWQMTLASQPGQTHVVEASADLHSWTPISTNTMVGTNMQIIVSSAGVYPQRFFRVLRCPTL